MTTMQTTGTKYAATQGLTTAQIAKLVRADIKAAVAAGTLPKARYSVRTSRSSMCSSIDVTISGLPFVTRTTSEPVVSVKGTWAPEALAAGACVEAIISAYNNVSTEWASDYCSARFYSQVDVESTYAEPNAALIARCLEVSEAMFPAPSRFVAMTGWDDASVSS